MVFGKKNVSHQGLYFSLLKIAYMKHFNRVLFRTSQKIKITNAEFESVRCFLLIHVRNSFGIFVLLNPLAETFEPALILAQARD